MTPIISSEWIKLRTVRMNWVLGFIAVLFPLLVSVLTCSLIDVRDLGARDIVDLVVNSSVVSALLFGVIGAVSIAGEFGHGTIRPTFAATPQRWRVLVAKGIVVAVFSLIAEALVVLLSYSIATAVASSRGASIQFDEVPQAQPATIGLIVFAALISLLGYAIGLIIRNTPSSVAILILWPLLLENIVGGVLFAAGVKNVFKFLPYSAGFALAATSDRNSGDPQQLGRLGGGIYFGLVVVALVALGAWITNRRDA